MKFKKIKYIYIFLLIIILCGCNQRQSKTTITTPSVITTTTPSVTEPTQTQTTKPIIPTTMKPITTTVSTSTTTKAPEPIYGDTYTLNVLAFNDIHGHIEQINGTGGISNVSYLVSEIRNEDEYDNTLLLANGDIFQETAISRVSYGRVLIDVMNEMKFDMMNLGNHEFDWGLDKILNYWDGDLANGEANFPLLNANIYDNSTNQLVKMKSGNVLTSTIVKKGPINVGLIGYIGNVYGSISKNMVEDYTFKASDEELKSSVLEIGSSLKDNGADVIIVSIHDGNSDGITYYNPNNLLAQLKYNDEYLVDAVLNGHTHTEQKGSITRDGGVAMPVIQSSPYISSTGALKEFGRIDLEIDLKTKDVTNTNYKHVYVTNALNNYDVNVEKIVNQYKEESSDILNEVYCQNLSSINRYDAKLQNWVSNLMMKSTGATAGLCNTGGLRSGVDKGNFGFDEVYRLNPFDNHIILVTITGANLQKFLNDNQGYYFCYTDTGGIDTTKLYNLAIIDYVYYSYYFRNYQNTKAVDTNLIVRDLIIEELRLHKESGFYLEDDYNDININMKNGW